jgi:hypothetical protein
MYVSVHVDESDLLDELSDDVLIKEVRRRKLGGFGEYTIPAREARQSIMRKD